MAVKIVTSNGQSVQSFEDWKNGGKSPNGSQQAASYSGPQIVNSSGQTVQSFEQWRQNRTSGVTPGGDTAITDWMHRYNRVMQGVSSYEKKRNGGFTQDASGGFGSEIDSLIADYDGIERYAADYGFRDAQKYLVQLKKLQNFIQGINDNFSQFEDEDTYNRYMEYWQDQEEKKNLDLDAYSREISALEQQLADYDPQIDWTNPTDRKKFDAEMEAMQADIDKRKNYLTLAKRVQEQAANEKKYSQVTKNADFAEKSGFDSSNKEIGYQYMNADAAGRLDLEQKYGQYVKQFADHAYDSLVAEEKAIYNYLMNTGDRKGAAEYLKYIEQTAQERKGTAADAYIDKLVEEDPRAKIARYAYMANVGLDQHKTSMQDLGHMLSGNEEYVSPSAIQYAGAKVREDLASDGKKLPDWMGGGSTGQMVGDIISTTANMAPSILASTMVGLLNPSAGATVGRAMMSGSAAGSGYREMINEGYSKEQARLYGLGVGAAEYFMESALSGISKLGGVPTKALAKWAENVDKALFNFALRVGGSGFSEGLEEGLTDVVTGWLKSRITHEDFYAEPADALYSSLLGFVTGILFEGPSVASDIGQQSRQGKAFKDAKGVNALKEMGAVSTDSTTRSLADRISNDSGNFAVGKLARKVESETTRQNSADLAQSLTQKGMPEKTAKQYGEMLSYMLEAGSDTEIQRMVMESDPVIGQVLREAQMPGSKVQQRLQNLSAASGKTRSIERVASLYGKQAEAVKQVYNQGQKADGTKQDVETFAYGFQRAFTVGRENGNASAITEEIAPGLTPSQRELAYNLGRDAVAAEKAEATKRTTGEESSVHILNEDGSLGDAVRIAEITSNDRNNVTYVLEDGRTVSEDQLSFSGDNAVLDTVKELGLDVQTANIVIRGNKTITKADTLVAHGIDDAFRYGSHGYSLERLAKDSPFAALLTEEMRTAVYNAGKNAPDAAEKKPPAVKVKTRGKNAGIYYDAGGGNVTAYRPKQFGKLEHKRESGVYAAQVLQKLGIGVDFYFFRSYVNSKGERVYLDADGMEQKAPNGWYDKSDGSIHIDLNAGNDGQGLTLFTMAHELTHFIEQWSPEKYKVLADFLIQNYEKGRSMDELVLIKQQALSAGRKKPVSYEEAYSEVIADSMEAMLADGNVMDKLRELKAKDSDLVARMKEFFDRMVKRITKYYQGLQPESEEGQLVLEMKDQFKQIQQLFAEALVEAGENYQAAEGQKNTAHEGRQFSDRYPLSQLTEQDRKYLDAVNRGDMETAQKIVDAVAKVAGYIIKAYHGTSRSDRVGTVFLPERATSGPMAFFTDNRDIAEHYAKDKADTSLAYDEEYADYYSQFRVTKNGKSIKVQDLWRTLPYSEKQRLKDAGKHITWDEDIENIVWDKNATHGLGNWDAYTLNEHKGNAIEALIDCWLESGELYGNEGDFLKVLDLAGIKGVEYRDPDVRHEKVYETFLNIQNPFITATVDEVFVSKFEEWYSKQPAGRYDRNTNAADMWDKNSQTAEKFLERLRDDIRQGTSYAWTSIPDSMTDYLKHLGHDGIQDTGGKNGGEIHTVWIPFTSEQVKSADPVTYDDAGNVIPLSERFNPEKKDIRYSDRKKPGEYGGIREVLAKKGLDELSVKLGDRFPLSAKFDETMRNDGTKLVMEDVSANSVAKGRKESAYKVGRKAFTSKYGVKTHVHINQMGIDAELYADVANESISKAIGQTNEQSTLDVIPHVADILSNSILMGIERIAHTDNKGTALYGYRLYNLYWYVDGNKKTPHALVCTVVQDLNKAEGYVFKNIENVTIGRGLPGANAGMSSSVNGDIYTVAQLYDAVKRIDRNEGGLKYSDADRNYLFSYTERDDGVAYQDRSTGTSNRDLLAGALEELVRNPDELEFLQKYRDNVAELDKQEAKLQELRRQIREMSFSKGPRDTKKLKELQEEAGKTANRIDIYDKRLLGLEATVPLKRVLERERQKVKQKADADKKAAVAKVREETKAAIEGVQSEYEIMEREFLRLMRAYEKLSSDSAEKAKKAKKTIDQKQDTIDSYKADLATMEREFLRVMKGYETAERKSNAFWEGEFKRLMREYEASGRKVDRLEAKLKAQRESIRSNVDSRRRTVLRNKIRKDIRELDKILNRGNKKRNVKQGMQDFVAKAIATGEILFADLDSDTDLIASGIQADMNETERKLLTEAERYVRQIAELEGNEAMADVLAARQKGLDEVLKQLQPVLERERIRINSADASSAFDALVAAYESLQESPDTYIAAAFNPDALEYLRSVKHKFAGTLVKDMTQEQLQELHKCYKMVMTMIRDANKAFVDGRSVQADAEQMVQEFQERKIPAKKVGIILRNLSNAVGWNYEKLYYALERINSPTLKRLYQNLADSENITMQDVQEAKAFQMEMVEKYHYNDWKIDQKMERTFLDNNGKEFHLTLGELMALYAYSRREGADRHIEVGGFTFGKNALTDPAPASTYKLTADQVAAISDLLTPEQKSFAEAMQRYLSKTMGAKGNEVSMKLYGIEMFGEENYFPLHIAGEYKARAQESQAKAEAGFQSMTNAGFTKARNTNATAPIVLESFMEVWVDHVNEMARYHGAVPALEDIRRVMNYSVYSDAMENSVSVKAAMTNAYGKQAVQYFDSLYREANSGAVTDKMDAVSKSLLSAFRKNSVAYSGSVVIQQPASIYRAMAIVDPKYFGKHGLFTLTSGVLRVFNKAKWNAAYADMMKYAPGVTMAKEIGGFDTSTGGSIRSYLLDTDRGFKQSMKNGTAAQKAGAVLNVVDDNVIANLPNVADKIAWIEIWEACRRETVANNPKLATGSEAFKQKVGQRFTEVIRATQVYDSMFSKSPMLKSKNLAVQYVVSFMNEPNTVANMAEKALRDVLDKDIKTAGKTVGALATSIVVTNLLKSIIYAMRDDEEDETFREKYLSAVAGNLVSDVNLLNYVPYARDVLSLMEGYDVERADMSVVADAVNAIRKLRNLNKEDVSRMTEEELEEWDKKVMDARWKVAETLSPLAGIPLKNIRREVLAVINAVKIRDLDKTRESTELSIRHAIEEATGQAERSDREKLYEAMLADDEVYIQRLKTGYKDEDAYHAAIRKVLREKDSRIWEAAIAWNRNDLAEYLRIGEEIVDEGHFEFDDIYSAIQTEANSMEESDSDPAKAKGKFTSDKFGVALGQNNTGMADIIRKDLIDTKVANGKTREEAASSVESTARSQLKELFGAGSITGAAAEKLLVRYGGYDQETSSGKVAEWQFEKDHPELDGRITYSQYKRWEADGKSRGVALDTFTDVAEYQDSGTSGSNRSQAEVADYINRLPISTSQKDALWCCFWKESTLYKNAPWHTK